VGPFRADQVGSLCARRSCERRTRSRCKGSTAPRRSRSCRIAASETSSACRIRRLQGITDGEYRRTSFHADFIERLDGAKAAGRLDVKDTVSGFDEKQEQAGKPSRRAPLRSSGSCATRAPIELENFKFVKANTRRTPSRRCLRRPCFCAAGAPR